LKTSAQEDRSDETLIRAAKAGDKAAFSALVRKYEETVYRFSFKICRDKEQAKETLQDTFISVFRKLHSFDGKSKFSTWLYTIVTNNCLMRHRKARSREIEESLEVLDHPPHLRDGAKSVEVAKWGETPADVVLKKELRQVLDAAIVKLPESYRVVFALRDMEGRSTEETAKILRLSQEAVKSRLRRARAFLRDELNPYMAQRREEQA
jgi:RNA polymerase sigma-70 factor (ECF subfamily)